jgi:hypothetical protein
VPLLACHLRCFRPWLWLFPRRSERPFHHRRTERQRDRETPEILLTIHRLAHPGNAISTSTSTSTKHLRLAGVPSTRNVGIIISNNVLGNSACPLGPALLSALLCPALLCFAALGWWLLICLRSLCFLCSAQQPAHPSLPRRLGLGPFSRRDSPLS